MGRVWRRDDWNDIIRRVNDLSENPPEGRDALPPLDEVPAGHKWSVADIQTARDRLLAICASNVFAADLVKWTQDCIDELEIAIAAGWCAESPCSEDGTVIARVVPEITGDPFQQYPYPDYTVSGAQCPEYTGPTYLFVYAKPAVAFNGMQVAKAGIHGRTWEAWRVNYGSGGAKTEARLAIHPYDQQHGYNEYTGSIDCDGVIRDADRDSWNIPVAMNYAFFPCVGADLVRQEVEVRVFCNLDVVEPC